MKPLDFSPAPCKMLPILLALVAPGALSSAVQAADDGNYRVIASFDPFNQGAYGPMFPPTQGRDGRFYGTAILGGQSGCGAIWRLAAPQPTKIADASPENCAPIGLVLGANGTFYGIAYTDHNQTGSHIISVAVGPQPSISALAALPALANARSLPVQGTDGKFYGVADHGGAYGLGLIYVYDPIANAVTTLHDMQQPDGVDPMAGLVIGTDGRLYGATPAGGKFGKGTIFAITTAGVFQKLYDVPNKPGALEDLYTPMTLGEDGALYGVAQDGGAKSMGAVYRLDPTGIVKTIFSFRLPTQGYQPLGGLALGADGAFYGVTSLGVDAKYGSGALYRLVPDQSVSPARYTYEKLHGFKDGTTTNDGFSPIRGPAVTTSGNILGTTSAGGLYPAPDPTIPWSGTIYGYEDSSLSPVLIPVPSAATKGQWVGILGENFRSSGTTVAFGSLPAPNVQVVSPTYLRVKVPATAVTNKIVVSTIISPTQTVVSSTTAVFPVVSP